MESPMAAYQELQDLKDTENLKDEAEAEAADSADSGSTASTSADIHGRITIFSLDHCPHCKRTKTLFRDLGWEYYEISLTDYPSAKQAMLRLSNRLTVPQVFFNTQHLGGADDVKALASTGDLEQLYQDMLGSEPPTAADFQRPAHAPVAQHTRAPLTEPQICIGGRCTTYGAVLEILEACVGNGKGQLQIGTHASYGKKYNVTFTGSNLVDVLLSRFNLPGGRAEAVQVATMLLKVQVFSHLSPPHAKKFMDSDIALYQLRSDSKDEAMVLNSLRVWNDRVDTNVLGTVKFCKSMLYKLLDTHTNAFGRVDYNAVRADPAFLDFELATCEFQQVDLASMNENTRTAFCINLYNMMIKHAFVKQGIPRSFLSKAKFFYKPKYNIGGHLFSFSDLEGGILRANRRQPYTWSKPFGSSDPRRAFALTECDPRIHFALNCGASSCPPVKTFTGEALDEELQIVAMAFCEDSANLCFAPDGNTVYLSKIFDWYEGDFGDSKSARLQLIASWLRGDKRAKLEEIIRLGAQIRRLPYDWSTDATESSASFGTVLRPHEKKKSCACVIL